MAKPRIFAQPGYIRATTARSSTADIHAELGKIEQAAPNKNTVHVDADYTVTPRDRVLIVDTTDGAVTATLFPAKHMLAEPLTVIKKVAANAVHVVPATGETIGGLTDLMWTTAGRTFTLQPDGISTWYIL